VLDEVLSLDGRSAKFTRDTPLLGAIPELDSMAVVTLITTMEDQFGLVVDDDDIDGATFCHRRLTGRFRHGQVGYGHDQTKAQDAAGV